MYRDFLNLKLEHVSAFLAATAGPLRPPLGDEMWMPVPSMKPTHVKRGGPLQAIAAAYVAARCCISTVRQQHTNQPYGSIRRSVVRQKISLSAADNPPIPTSRSPQRAGYASGCTVIAKQSTACT